MYILRHICFVYFNSIFFLDNFNEMSANNNNRKSQLASDNTQIVTVTAATPTSGSDRSVELHV